MYSAECGVSVVNQLLNLLPTTFENINVNVLGVFNTARAAAKLWIDRKYEGGSIVINVVDELSDSSNQTAPPSSHSVGVLCFIFVH